MFRPRPPLGAAAKYHRPWQDPYIIVYQPFPDTFVLRDPQRPFADVLTVHYNQIKPAPDCGPPPDSPLFLVPSGSLPPADTEADLARPPLRPSNPFHPGVLATDAASQLDSFGMTVTR
ncbi:hypothetical protein SprV_0100395700 [Sparganum proliferum]